MAKVTLSTLDSLENQTSAIETINANFNAIVAALEITVSRDGTVPNYLTSALDLNSKRILNVGAPSASSDAARLEDVQNGVSLVDYAVPSLVGNNGKFLSTDETTIFWQAGGTGDLLSTNNLSDLTSHTTARTNLGLGSAAIQPIGTSGSSVPLLNTNNTHSGTNSFTGAVTLSGGVTFSGTADVRVQTTPTVLNDDSVGYRGAPQTIRDADYTLALSDAGRGLSHSSASTHIWTIPPDADVAFPVHTMIALDNYGAGTVTVTRGAGVTLRANGSGTSADQPLAQFFVHTLYKIGANYWVYV